MIGGIGVMTVECMSVQEKVTAFNPASGSGQMSSGLKKPNQTSLTKMVGSMLWIFQGLMSSV